MTNFSIWGAWAHWASGSLPPDAILWGLKLFWWGRIGKFLEGLAGATIVADIVGADRITAAGNALHGRFSFAAAVKISREGFSWLVLMLRYAFYCLLKKQDTPQAIAVFTQAAKYRAIYVNFVVCLALIIADLHFLKMPGDPWWRALGAAVITYFILFISIGPIVTTLAILASLLIGLLVDKLFIEPLAWALQRAPANVKIITLLLLLVGFHFDFLTS